MQERPIIYLLAKCLWRQGCKFELEDQRSDLYVNEKRVEFKFNFDRCQEVLTEELEKYGENLEGMWDLVLKGLISKSWGVIPKIYGDVCIKKPDLFVWIICSRNLSRLSADDLKRLCVGRKQSKYNAKHPYSSDSERLAVADSLLGKLQVVRPFSLIKQKVETKGDFPSTYHFRICEFACSG